MSANDEDSVVKRALEMREKGNAAFRVKSHKSAIADYSRAIALCRGYAGGEGKVAAEPLISAMANKALRWVQSLKPTSLPSSSSTQITAQSEKIKRELIHLHLNRSACYLALSQVDEAITDAEEATKLDPKWGKAYFRLADALFAKQDSEGALLNYQTAQSLLTNEKKITERIKQIHRWRADTQRDFTIHQLLPGRDICVKPSRSPINKMIYQFAVGMQNLIYIIADIKSKTCIVTDPCWDTDGILRIIKAHNYQLKGVFMGHHHFDHVGGTPPPPFDKYKVKVPGLHSLVKYFSSTASTTSIATPIIGSSNSDTSDTTFKIYVHCEDWKKIVECNPCLASIPQFNSTVDTLESSTSTQISENSQLDRTLDQGKSPSIMKNNSKTTRKRESKVYVVFTNDGDTVVLGQSTPLKFIHTPGHTPGSQCLLVHNNRLFTSDTLFCGSCGRHDLEGGNRNVLRASLLKLRHMFGNITSSSHYSIAAKLLDNDEEIVVYPGHAYGGMCTTISDEQATGILSDASLASI